MEIIVVASGEKFHEILTWKGHLQLNYIAIDQIVPGLIKQIPVYCWD
jgi:hypothetical protein